MKIFIDFEATQENEIVAIGAVTEIGETFYSLVKPQFSSISQYLSQLIHISNRMLKTENTLNEIFDLMYHWLYNQCPDITKWEFFAYGSDDKYVSASLRNIYSEKPLILAALMIAKMTDVCEKSKLFFKGSISLIKALNYIENSDNKQCHNPLEDALMLQKVYEYMESTAPLAQHPFSKKSETKTEIAMPSGSFWCIADCKKKNRHDFKNIDEAIDWFIKNKIGSAQRDYVHRENIMKNIMCAVKRKSKYAGCNWYRNKKEEIA